MSSLKGQAGLELIDRQSIKRRRLGKSSIYHEYLMALRMLLGKHVTKILLLNTQKRGNIFTQFEHGYI